MNSFQLSIRKLSNTEVTSFKALVDLFVRVFGEPRQLLAENDLLKLLKNPMFHVFVAEADGAVVGGCTVYELTKYYAERPEWFIYDVAVKKSFQNQGIGKQLMAALKSAAIESGVGNVFVLAHSEDTQAVKFYHSTHGTAEKVDLFEYDL